MNRIHQSNQSINQSINQSVNQINQFNQSDQSIKSITPNNQINQSNQSIHRSIHPSIHPTLYPSIHTFKYLMQVHLIPHHLLSFHFIDYLIYESNVILSIVSSISWRVGGGCPDNVRMKRVRNKSSR